MTHKTKAPRAAPAVRAGPGAKAKARAKAEITPRVARRERRRDRSREEIIEGARRVLLRAGIAKTTLDAVAREVGLSKAALYYYFPSKDALLFEIVYGEIAAQARAIHDAVAAAANGGDALRAIIRETVTRYAPRMDDFRVTYLHNQVAGADAVQIDPAAFARLRPLNDLAYGGAARVLAQQPGRAGVEPRLLAFLANVAAIGVLTMKGMVEKVGDPLLYSDAQLIEGLARVFAAAAEPRPRRKR